jgi:hypothetical protein
MIDLNAGKQPKPNTVAEPKSFPEKAATTPERVRLGLQVLELAHRGCATCREEPTQSVARSFPVSLPYKI